MSQLMEQRANAMVANFALTCLIQDLTMGDNNILNVLARQAGQFVSAFVEQPRCRAHRHRAIFVRDSANYHHAVLLATLDLASFPQWASM